MKTLERRLGLTSVIAISIAAMLGSGLFVLPGLAATHSGPSVWLAYMVAGLCVLPAAFSKAELATAMPESGGTYVYLDRTFGPLAGTIAGLGLWLSLLLKSAFALVGFGAYLYVLADVPLKPVSLALLAAVIMLNVLGVRKVGKVQTVVVLLAIFGLTVIAARGFVTLDRTLLSPAFPNGMGDFWFAVSFVYISYAGVTKVAAIAEEVEDPGRNLPIGILASLVLVTGLYTVVTFTLAGNVPVSQLGGDLRPIYTLAHTIAGEGLGLAAAVLGVITMTSMANSGLLAASRFPFAMSRNDLMPAFLRQVSVRFTTPVASILLTGSLMGLALLFLKVEGIAKLASSLMIMSYMAENLAVLVLRESSIQWYKPSFRSPGYPYMQMFGLVLGLVLVTSLGFSSVLALASMVIPGLLLFFLFGRRKTDRLGVLGRLGPRQELLVQEQPHLVLPKKAAVVVPLLGKAFGAEALAELGDALGGGAKVEVVHIRNLPEQIALDADLGDPMVGSLGRRIHKLATTRGRDIDFDSVATHDHIRVVHEISRRVHCEWLVMEWQGKTERGVLPFNPLGWLVDHLSCNLALFKDVGSRFVGSILVFPEPGPHDALVAITADHLAKVYDAELTFVGWARGSGSETTVEAQHAYLDQLRGLCTGKTDKRIAYGDDAVDAIGPLTAEYDLLVMCSPPELRWWTQIRGSTSDRLMRQAACSVLRLKAPRRLVDRSFARDGVEEGAHVRIDEYLAGQCVAARLPAMTKQGLFEHFAKRFATAVDDVSAELIEEALWERERAQSTAIGNGLAVPHATVEGARRSYVGVFTTTDAIDYRAPDGAPVDVFFVTVGPPGDRHTHLKILSTLAWLVTETRFLERLRAADNDSELLAVLLASSTLHVRPPSDRPLPAEGSEAGDPANGPSPAPAAEGGPAEDEASFEQSGDAGRRQRRRQSPV